MTIKPRHYGQAGHFCASEWCLFHLHTHVGKFCISTVGEYRPPIVTKSTLKSRNSARFVRHLMDQEIGHGRKFETFVFDTSRRGRRWTEIETAVYDTRTKANNGHDRMVQKYIKWIELGWK